MKRFFCAILFLVFTLSPVCGLGEAENDLYLLWDVPFGISLDEAAQMLHDKIGAALEAVYMDNGMAWSYSTPLESPITLNGYDYSLSTTDANALRTETPAFFTSLELRKGAVVVLKETSVTLTEFQAAFSNIYNMLSSKFGEPDASCLVVPLSATEDGVFDTPLLSDGTPDLASVYQASGKDFEIKCVWRNIELSFDLSFHYADTPMFGIDLHCSNTPVDLSTFAQSNGSVFDYWTSYQSGITSF